MQGSQEGRTVVVTLCQGVVAGEQQDICFREEGFYTRSRFLDFNRPGYAGSQLLGAFEHAFCLADMPPLEMDPVKSARVHAREIIETVFGKVPVMDDGAGASGLTHRDVRRGHRPATLGPTSSCVHCMASQIVQHVLPVGTGSDDASPSAAVTELG